MSLLLIFAGANFMISCNSDASDGARGNKDKGKGIVGTSFLITITEDNKSGMVDTIMFLDSASMFYSANFERENYTSRGYTFEKVDGGYTFSGSVQNLKNTIITYTGIIINDEINGTMIGIVGERQLSMAFTGRKLN